MGDALESIATGFHNGCAGGITSFCCAHPLVLDAALREAAAGTSPVLVEATSNQVNQGGGYTGMQPAGFLGFLHAIADRAGVDRSRIIFGGDHLGPNPWRDRPTREAMANAEALVAAYAAAGATKLHFDCSMSCADEDAPLCDVRVAERAARLVAVAEAQAPDQGAVSYVVGTEVPAPGGASKVLGRVTPTTPAAARATLAAHRRALQSAGLGHVWPRVRALVVQPGVEFDGWRVAEYDPDAATALREILDDAPQMVFEAHSTDYQSPEALARLVDDGWAVLKVGPALTFALREALVALEHIEHELCTETRWSQLSRRLEQVMLAEPAHWSRYYDGDDRQQRLARRFSFSDRVRYYWPDLSIRDAEHQLLDNLAAVTIPLPLLSQYLPLQYARVREGTLQSDPSSLVIDHIRDVVRVYVQACTPTDHEPPFGKPSLPGCGCRSVR